MFFFFLIDQEDEKETLNYQNQYHGCWESVESSGWYPDSKVHEAYMGPTWGRPHAGPMNLAMRVGTVLT